MTVNAELTQYLADVIRGEKPTTFGQETLVNKQHITKSLRSSIPSQFIVDHKYALRLDEII